MTALIALTEEGARTARRLQPSLPGAVLYGRTARVADADRDFDDTGALLRDLFLQGTPVIGFCAAGILIRFLAPLLADKHSEPAVVAVAEDGSSAVPLLGGHHGANALARQIAAALGGHAAITTAGDLRVGPPLDAPPPGWVLENPHLVKPVTAALLAGEPVGLTVEAGDAAWLDPSRFAGSGAQSVLVTERAVSAGTDALVLHPPVLAVGIGAERGVPEEEGVEAVRRVLTENGLSAAAVGAVGSIDIKADEPAVLAAAAFLNSDPRFMTADELEAEAPRLANPSDLVFKETGCHGVAEGAALALAGAEAELIVPKARLGRVTVAVAKARGQVNASVGRSRGRLFVVGIGPGQTAWRTPEAVAALRAADGVVGYDLYLDLVGDLIAGKEQHRSPLGDETGRALKALTLAAQGRTVALVCSGDPGIYALATLVYEQIEAAADRALRGVCVTVVPGISAFQAAAARLGAPMGHDFCLISLSDLLTPRAIIRRRLKAAAAGDFVVAFYNPQSLRRRTLLGEAREILLAERPGMTPVAVARNLGRPGETVTVTTLDAFEPEAVDMLSLVVIGNSESRILDLPDGMRIYTPRGYAQKSAGTQSAGTQSAGTQSTGTQNDGTRKAEGALS